LPSFESDAKSLLLKLIPNFLSSKLLILKMVKFLGKRASNFISESVADAVWRTAGWSLEFPQNKFFLRKTSLESRHQRPNSYKPYAIVGYIQQSGDKNLATVGSTNSIMKGKRML
jgi:hypothetical protein